MNNASPTQADSTPAQFTIERTLNAPADAVWRMWTTREGLESWWGRKASASSVRHLDVRVGGRFEIAMTAARPEIVRFLERRAADDQYRARRLHGGDAQPPSDLHECHRFRPGRRTLSNHDHRRAHAHRREDDSTRRDERCHARRAVDLDGVAGVGATDRQARCTLQRSVTTFRTPAPRDLFGHAGRGREPASTVSRACVDRRR